MNRNIHIDMMEVLDNISHNRTQDIINRAVLDGDSQAMKFLRENPQEELAPPKPNPDDFGERQVESLLRFVVEHPLERAMEDAEADNIVYDGLGEHRILGKKKKKKKVSY